jgi:hypothetical protein
VAAEKSEEPGVLGNLPRSRPGHRSDKRGGARATAAEGNSPAASPSTTRPAKATRTGAKPPPKKRVAAAKSAAARPTAEREPAAGQARPSSSEPAQQGPTDPLTGAVRLAGKVAEAGLKTAGSLLRRLPGR